MDLTPEFLGDFRIWPGLKLKPSGFKVPQIAFLYGPQGFHDLAVNRSAQFFSHVAVQGEKLSWNEIEDLELIATEYNLLKSKIDGALLLVGLKLARLRRMVLTYTTLSHDALLGVHLVRGMSDLIHRACPALTYKRTSRIIARRKIAFTRMDTGVYVQEG
jgi:hypothetical protein